MGTVTYDLNTYDSGTTDFQYPERIVDANPTTYGYCLAADIGGIQENYSTVKPLVPVNAVITKVQVILRHHEAGSADITKVQLIKGGTPTGDIITAPQRTEATDDTLSGSTNDLWGVALTAADVLTTGTSGFGVKIAYDTDGVGKLSGVYEYRIQVYIEFTGEWRTVALTETCAVYDQTLRLNIGDNWTTVVAQRRVRATPAPALKYSLTKTDADWDTAHDSATGAASDYFTYMAYYTGATYWIRRLPIFFDTANAIPSSHTISSATIVARIWDWWALPIVGDTGDSFYIFHDPDDDRPGIPLVTSDFEYSGYSSQDSDKSGGQTGGVDSATLNANGLAWIKKAGSGKTWTRWIVRNEYDVDDIGPDSGHGSGYYAEFRLTIASSAAAGPVTKALSETLAFSEAIAKRFRKDVHETVTLSDTVSKGWLGVLADTLGLSDAAPTIVKTARAIISETLGLSDTFSRVHEAYRTFSETLSLSDAARKTASLVRSETLGLGDSLEKWFIRRRILSQDLSLSDSRALQAAKVLSQSLQFGDTTSTVLSAVRKLSETLGLDDLLSKRFIKVITDTLTLSATPTASLIEGLITRALSETLTFGETLSKRMTKRLSQDLSIGDTVLPGIGGLVTKAISETLSFAEDISKTFNKRLGPNHLYRLWDYVYWAADGETAAIGGGKTWRDVARNGDHYKADLTLNGAMGDVEGKYGNATYLNGTTWWDYGIIDNSGEINITDEFSIAVWVYPSAANSSSTPIAVKMDGEAGYCWILYITNSGFSLKPYFVGVTSAGGRQVFWPTAITPNQWHLIVATYSQTDGGVRISVDADSFVSNVGIYLPMLSSSDPIKIGRFVEDGNYYTGRMDDLILFNKALTQGEVSQLYRAKLGLNLNNLTADKAFWGPHITDTFNYNNYKPPIALSEALGLSEAIVKRFAKVISDSLPISETLSKGLYWVLQDSLSISDVIAKTFTKKVSDSVPLSDTIRKSWLGVLTDTLGLSDATKKVVHLVKTESLNIDDTFNRIHDAIRWFTESLGLDDTVSKNFFKVLSDSFGLDDTMKRRVAKRLSDTLALADSVAKRFVKVIRDTLQLSAIVSRVGGNLLRQLTEAFGLSDSLSWSFFKRLTEALSISDSLTRIRWTSKVLSETLAFGVTLRKGLFWKLQDSLGLDDSLSKRFTKTLSDALGLSDTILRRYAKVLTEALGVDDSLAKTFDKVLAQSMSLSYEMRKGIQRVLADTLSFSDTVSSVQWMSKRLAEALGISDGMTKRFVKRISDSLPLDDVIRKSWFGVLTDTLGLSDAIRKTAHLVRTETLGLSDTFSKFINFLRKLTEALGLSDVVISGITFEVVSVTPLAGTFPRPARIATLTLKVAKANGDAISGATVTVVIQKPDGTTYKTLTLTESAFKAGLYSADFRIFGADELGSYPFDVTATYGANSGTYSGFITIFQGPLAGIHYR